MLAWALQPNSQGYPQRHAHEVEQQQHGHGLHKQRRKQRQRAGREFAQCSSCAHFVRAGSQVCLQGCVCVRREEGSRGWYQIVRKKSAGEGIPSKGIVVGGARERRVEGEERRVEG